MLPSVEAATLRITHLPCKRTSYNPDDIEQHYCGFCHRFHDKGETQIEVKGQLLWTVLSTQ